LFKTAKQRAPIKISAMLRLFNFKIGCDFGLGSTICDDAWLRRAQRSTGSEQDELSVYR